VKRTSIRSRFKKAWTVFNERGESGDYSLDIQELNNLGRGYTYNPSRPPLSISNESSIVMPLYNKIANDVAAVEIRHARTDQNGSYLETINSSLQYTLTVEANKDQTGRALIMDLVLSLIDEGSIALVPVVTDVDILKNNSYEIYDMRVGRILQWYPDHVEVELYNDTLGDLDRVTLPKKDVAIIENPHYLIMNEPNSTLKRLITKLNTLDVIDTQSGAGKLDLIIQLPYIIKTEARRVQAELRKKAIEDQLKGPYGIAYTDGVEKITQLNRPVDNNLLTQITYLTDLLFNQLGLSPSVFDGTASEESMINYYNRTVEPIINAITDELKRKFLTKTAITQNQTVMYFRDPFRLVPVSQIAEIADKFTRNEILSSNEVRSIIGKEPSPDPKAAVLRNKNLPEVNDSKTPNEKTNLNKSKEDDTNG
jgi:hypothetical protein